MPTGRVHVARDRETVFDYLVDPRNRPEWQSSLRRVSSVVGEPGVGQTWVDETRPGPRPRMRTTAFDRPALWSEAGVWRFVRAELTLELHEAPEGCDVDYRFRVRALGPVGVLAAWAAVPAVRADLRRAAARLAA